MTKQQTVPPTPVALIAVIVAVMLLAFVIGLEDSPDEMVGSLIGLAIAGLISWWVFRDAGSRGLSNKSAQGWAIFTYVIVIIGLPAYLIARPKRDANQHVINDPSTAVIADKIREIAVLRSEGFITDEQFESKKAELLEKI